MTEKYDCTADVTEHKRKVSYWLDEWARHLTERAKHHDESKLKNPIEKALFDHWTPELRRLVFGSDEYKSALEGMGDGVKLHYKANRHHPEHYPNGINDMTITDITEMVADWMAAAWAKGTYVDLSHAAQRFGIGDQLIAIIANTLREEDVWNEIGGANIPYLCPPDKRHGYVHVFGERDSLEEKPKGG